MDQLHASLSQASRLVERLEAYLADGEAKQSSRTDGSEPAELERRLELAEEDRGELTKRLVDLEKRASRVMNLYVATYQLHSTLDPGEVQAAIAEVARDLLGAERFVLLLRDEGGSECRLALAEGLEDDHEGLFSGASYRGGDAMVDATLKDGVLRIGPMDLSAAVAVVPLRIQDAIVGALVVLKVFGHRDRPLTEDRELLDLLAAHSASALLAARAYSSAARKLRTLESLLTLLGGS